MRKTTLNLIKYYLDELNLSGDALEIGGHRLSKCAISVFPAPRFKYHDLNIKESDIPNTIIADIADCREEIPDNSFDIVFSSDVFEHLQRPWLAANEISRILKPGGIAFIFTLWAWRNHPCPIDYWRYSPECLEFLFSDLKCLEKGYDLSLRRKNQMGFWQNGNDSVPVDIFGGWRENWASYYVGGKGFDEEKRPVPFKGTGDPIAKYLRMGTQGRVTNLKMRFRKLFGRS